jgi:hypothetical protein
MPVTRKRFISSSAAAFLFSIPESLSQPVQSKNMNAGFSLKIMTTNWGFNGTANEFCIKAKQAGYDGIEVRVPDDEKGRNEIVNAAQSNNLLVGFLYGGDGKDFQKHLDQFMQGINQCRSNLQTNIY